MKTFKYFLILLLISFVSCQKEETETESFETTQEVDSLTTFKLGTSKNSLTVIGQNDPTIDIAAVQNAVDNYNHVILTGVFDFGMDEVTGGVDITRPNVTLKGPATILNGAKTASFQELGELVYPISIQAPGVILWKLQIQGDHNGVVVSSQDKGRPVILASNEIQGQTSAVIATATSGGIKLLNNSLTAEFGYLSNASRGTTVLFNNNINASLDGINMFDFDHRLYILRNSLDSIGFTAMWIGAWRVTEETGPEWGDNPPVLISGNDINIVDPFAAGIMIGSSADGINNVRVTHNRLTGVAGYGGLVKQPYGHNNIFMHNDLSGLKTYSPQIWVLGGTDSQYRNNKLGSVEPFSVGDFGPAFRDAATLVAVINWHYKDNWLNTPDPVNYGNRFINNDYKETGVVGWTDESEESFGAVLLLDFLERFDATFTPSDLPYVMENFVKEHKFPAGTDVCDQVLDLSNEFPNDLVPGNNHVVGWKECETEGEMESKYLATKTPKVFRQRFKEMHMRRVEALRKRVENK